MRNGLEELKDFIISPMLFLIFAMLFSLGFRVAEQNNKIRVFSDDPTMSEYSRYFEGMILKALMTSGQSGSIDALAELGFAHNGMDLSKNDYRLNILGKSEGPVVSVLGYVEYSINAAGEIIINYYVNPDGKTMTKVDTVEAFNSQMQTFFNNDLVGDFDLQSISLPVES